MDEHTKVLRTKAKLLSAFLSLIEQKPVEDISVAELCRKANVNRTTFYKHYSLPQDIAEAYLADMLARTLSEVRSPNASPYDILLNICRQFQTSPSAMLMLASPAGMEAALGRFLRQIAVSSSEENETVLYFICGGISTVLSRWSRFEPEIPAEIIAERLAGYLARLLENEAGDMK